MLGKFKFIKIARLEMLNGSIINTINFKSEDFLVLKLLGFKTRYDFEQMPVVKYMRIMNLYLFHIWSNFTIYIAMI